MEKSNLETPQKPAGNKKEVIVISGSSGLIGTALIHRIATQYRVAGLDNTGYPFPPAEAECVCLDITSDKSMESVFERIRYEYGNRIAPIVLLIISFSLYFAFKSIREAFLSLITIPFALIGGAYIIYFWGVNLSVAVAVGFIALFGIAVETGIVMVIYLTP